MATIELSMTETMKNVSLHVVVTDQREASARMWIGTRLIKLAARVMGCGIDVEVGAKPAKPGDWLVLEEGQPFPFIKSGPEPEQGEGGSKVQGDRAQDRTPTSFFTRAD